LEEVTPSKEELVLTAAAIVERVLKMGTASCQALLWGKPLRRHGVMGSQRKQSSEYGAMPEQSATVLFSKVF
jgi:hypothetical protein